eukprot:PhF_6_TR35089/c0_g1_i1/m.51141
MSSSTTPRSVVSTSSIRFAPALLQSGEARVLQMESSSPKSSGLSTNTLLQQINELTTALDQSNAKIKSDAAVIHDLRRTNEEMRHRLLMALEKEMMYLRQPVVPVEQYNDLLRVCEHYRTCAGMPEFPTQKEQSPKESGASLSPPRVTRREDVIEEPLLEGGHLIKLTRTLPDGTKQLSFRNETENVHFTLNYNFGPSSSLIPQGDTEKLGHNSFRIGIEPRATKTFVTGNISGYQLTLECLNIPKKGSAAKEEPVVIQGRAPSPTRTVGKSPTRPRTTSSTKPAVNSTIVPSTSNTTAESNSAAIMRKDLTSFGRFVLNRKAIMPSPPRNKSNSANV